RAAARGRGATPSRTRGPRPRGPGRAAPRPAWTATRSGAPRRDPWVAEPRRRCEHSRRPPGERARNRRPGVGGPGYPDPMTATPAPDAAATAARARRLSELHAAPEILRVVNVWDVVSARTVLALPQTTALATAGHSIAASFGYADGTIPLETTLDMVGRIVAVAGDVPVSADLDDGY